MKRVVIVVCDGLRADLVTPETTPNLVRIADAGTRFRSHRGVFPSTTRTTAASIATGCLPGRHGLEGNAVALDTGNGLEVLSVGPASFRDTLFEITGQTLKVPVISERVADHGGAVIYSNASPGAGLFLDPDAHGHLIHRTLGWGPGRVACEPLGISHDANGDAAMTARFIDEVLHDRRPAFALLWLTEPDHSQHEVALGSPAHLDVIRAADAQAGRVYDNISAGIDAGEILFICASDHGHETVREIVDVAEILIDADLKDAKGSPDVAVAPQGTSVTIYLSEDAKGRRDDIVDVLRSDGRFARVEAGDAIAELGLNAQGGIDIIATGIAIDEPNADGLHGTSIAFQGDLVIDNRVGCGQHGGLGTYEQSPFLIACGGGFERGKFVDEATSVIDIAPTAMRHLGLPHDDMDGTALQR